VQLVGKFWGESGVEFGGEVSQGVAQGKAFLVGGEYVFALWRMVHGGVVWLQFGQCIGYAGAEVGLKFL
jgi:hypothetical protein